MSKIALKPELQVQVKDNELLQERKCGVKARCQVEEVVEILKKDDIHCVVKSFDSVNKWPMLQQELELSKN